MNASSANDVLSLGFSLRSDLLSSVADDSSTDANNRAGKLDTSNLTSGGVVGGAGGSGLGGAVDASGGSGGSGSGGSNGDAALSELPGFAYPATDAQSPGATTQTAPPSSSSPASTVESTSDGETATNVPIPTPTVAVADASTTVPLSFVAGLADWTVHEDGGSAAGKGTVAIQSNNAVLTEGDSFVVSLAHQFTVAPGPTSLSFKYELDFDTTDGSAINDALEVALLDATGRSLVHTFDLSRDAFFNETEGLAPALGADADLNAQTVSLDLSDVFADSSATLVFRLVNNDTDTSTSVRISFAEQSVNQPPTGADRTVMALEDSPYTFATSDFGFSDPSNSPANNLAAVKVASLPVAGSLTNHGAAIVADQFIAAADIAGGFLKFSPASNANGVGYASFAFQVQDDGGTTGGGIDLDPTPRTITIDVTSVNDGPSGQNKTVTTLEDTAYTFAASDFGFNDGNDSPANNLLAVKITALPTAGTLALDGTPVAASQFVSLVAISGGLLKFTPAADGNGVPYSSFMFQVQDDGGTASGGIDVDSTPRTITLNVQAQNNDPPTGASKTVTTPEDTAYTFANADFGFADLNDSPANNLLAVKIGAPPAAGSLALNGTPVVAGQFVSAADIAIGLLKFTPAVNAQGIAYASFSFQVQDDGGTASGGIDLDPTPRMLTINVTPVNDAPSGQNKTVTALEDTAYTFAANDFSFSDTSDSPANSLLAVKISTLPTAGTLALNGEVVTAGQFVPLAAINGEQLKFTPAGGASSAAYASFTFQVQDNGGTAGGGIDLDPTPRGMTIHVTAVNDRPTGTPKDVTTQEDTAYTFAIADFGFFDASDSPPNNLLAVKIATLPAAGSLALNGVAVETGQFVSAANIAGGGLKFTPAANASGIPYTNFTFQVQDDGGTANGGVNLDPSPKAMTVNVTGTNDAPTGISKTIATSQNTAYTFAPSDFGFSDSNDSPANKLLAVRIGQLPGSGVLGVNGVALTVGQFVSAADITAGLLRFTPASNATGAPYTSFMFQVQDDGGTVNGGVNLDPSPKTMTINVTSALPTKFFVVDQSAHTTFRYAANGNAINATGLGQFNSRPRGVASNLAGDKLWVIDANKKAYVYSADGSPLGSWTPSGLNQPQDITTDGTDIWIVDDARGKVFRYADAAARTTGTQPASASFSLYSGNCNPSGIVTNGTTLWVTDDHAGKVFVYNVAGKFLGSWSLDTRNNEPSGITLNPGGGTDLWVVDRHDSVVYHYVGAMTRRSGSQLATDKFALSSANHHAEGIADPPILTVNEPVSGATLPVGQTIVLNGRAIDGAQPASPVRVNGQMVDVLDAAGDFFHQVQVAPGANTFTVEARDAAGATATTTLTIHGAQESAGAIDFARLSIVSGSTFGLYGRTSWQDASEVMHVDFGVQNIGQYGVNGPILVGVKNISDPTVRLRGAAGSTPDGVPYFDLSSHVAGGRLQPGQSSGLEKISFFVPNRERFTYELVFFAETNQAPRITTAPDVAAIIGKEYAYNVGATDPDGDTLAFSLTAAPIGMTISATSGQVTWVPTSADQGTQAVVIQVDDGRGGVTQQHYTLLVSEPPPNRPPVFTSIPEVSAEVNAEYRYRVRAKDADGDSLTFSLVSKPAGMTIDPASGQVTWTPANDQLGIQNVVVQANDGRGGLATQAYAIVLGQQPGNRPPVIISQPVVDFDVLRLPNPASGNVSPVHIDLDLGPGQSSTQSVSLTLPDVEAGQSYADILFVVDETITMAEDHDWLEGMIPQLDAALRARGIGPNRYILVGFGNLIATDVTGPPHTHNLLETANLSMFGPTSGTALGNQTLGAVLPLVAFEVTSNTTGQQLVLMSDTTSRPGDYRFHVLRPSVTTTPMTLGALTSGSIDVPSEKDQYTFTVTQPTRVYFDSRTNEGRVKWNLSGPAGALVSNRPFSNSDARFGSGSTVNLLPGDYTLTVAADSSVISPYEFRLIDVATATPIVPGTPVTGSRIPANSTNFYKFNAVAGDRFYFDLVTATQIDDPMWRLIDPFGNVLFTREFRFADSGDFDVLALPQTGTYTLMIEGGITDTAPNSYTFNVQPVPITTAPLVLGDLVSGSLTRPGEQDRYTFSLASPALVDFDSLVNNGGLNWTLTGPGVLISSRVFSASDGASVPNPVLSLVAGDYALVVDGFNQTVGDYSFRLSDLATATVLTPGTPVSGGFSPANETDLYRFNAVAGDRFSFDSQARTGAAGARWRLIDPFGTSLFNNAFNDTTTSDVATLTLAQPGSYTLLLEGGITDTIAGTYTFNVVPQGNVPLPPPPASTPLALGSQVDGTLATAADVGHYSFTLAGRTQLYFDALTNNGSLTWTLAGPAGTAISGRSFTSNLSNLVVPAGDYILTIDSPGTGNYSFRLWDMAGATPLVPGTPVSGQFNPGNETDLYKFSATAGDRFYFDTISSTFGGALSATWQLIDPYGSTIFNNAFGNAAVLEVDGPTLSQSGTYTLLIEGPISVTTTGTYSFNVQPATIATAPLTLGSTVSGSIAVSGEQDRYTFSLAANSMLYFDSHTNNGNLTWTLNGPAGAAVSGRGLATDAQLNNPVLNLAPGDYTLTIDGTGDQTGAYGFRLSDLTTATPLVPGTPVSAQLSPGNETDIYKFTAAAGDRFYFDVLSSDFQGALSAGWQLIDPFGNTVFNKSFGNAAVFEVDSPTLNQSGTYTLLIEGNIAAGGPGNYSFNVQPVSITTTPLTLGSLVTDSIATAGAQDQYTFTLPVESQLVFDSLTNSSVPNWTLVGPTGPVVSSRSFNVSDGLNIFNPVVNLPAGAYTLTVDASGDATASYSFRLSDLKDATAITPGTPVSSAFTAANETDLYRFDVQAGDRFYFDVQARSGASGASWKLINPFGAVRFSTGFSSTVSDVGDIVLGTTGTFTLLLEGAIGDATPGTYTFNVLPSAIAIQPLTLVDTVSGAISVKGEQDRYTFSLPAPKLLYFDSQINSSGLLWTIAGPAGTAVSGRGLSDPESNNPVLSLPAGDYSLTIHSPIDVTSPYTFRLADLASATPLTPGTPVSGSLSPGNETDLYAFNVTAGERFFFDVQARTGQSARWRLIDPVGNVVFNDAFDSAANMVDTLTLSQSGKYMLLVEGLIGATAPGTYTFNVQPVTIATQPLTLGSTVNAAIGVTGEQDRYIFTLPAAALVYFDVLTNGPFTWTLSGPAGTPIQGRTFGTTDLTPILSLPAGEHTLTIDASGKATGAYGFRLSDLASATPLTPGTPVSGSIDPAIETDLFRFTAVANEQYSFDVQARTNGGGARWRLIDPLGGTVFANSFSTTSSDVGTTTLLLSGQFTLLLEGAITDTGSGTYTFNVIPQGSVTPPDQPPSTPLVLGTLVSDAISVAAEQDRYSFSLPAAALLAFDALTPNANITWSLTGPTGTVVSNRSFTGSDAANGNPVLSLPTGTYVLTVAATGTNTGSYSFRLSDLATATALTPGTPVTGSFDPANETDLFKFNAQGGDRFYFDSVARTNTGNSRWRLVDPFGNVLFASFFTGGDVDSMTLAQAGTYSLLLEGGIADAGVGTYTINVVPVPVSTTPLVLGDLVNGALAVPGEQDRYTFTLPTAAVLFFDSLSNNAQLSWSLTGPSGTIVSNRNFTSSDAVNGNPVLVLTAGDYALTLDGNAETTGAYVFRLSDNSSATPITPGTPFSGTLDPGNETDLYRFTATAGEKFYFDVLARSGAPSARWRLVDPFGNIVFTNGFDATSTIEPDVLTLQAGDYTLLLEGHAANTTSGTYTINVQPVTFSSQPLTLGSAVQSALATAGEQDDYTFFGVTGQRVLFDGLVSATNISARLFAPSTNQVFTTPAASNFGPFFLPETGIYRLNLDGNGDVAGSYGFVLHDVASASHPETNGDLVGRLDLGQGSDLFLVDAAAGETLVFTPGNDLYVGTAEQVAVATRSLVAFGNIEDGYQAIDFGLGLGVFREGAARNVVLVTDENRDVIDPTRNFTNTFTDLEDTGALLNGIHDAQFQDSLGRVALGVDFEGTAYIADGAGGFIAAPGGKVVTAREATKEDYIDMEWGLGGAAWDTNQLRVGGLPALSFTKAFVEIKAREIAQQLGLKVVASDPNAAFQNLTGVVDGVVAGETATFDVKITGDGTPQSFDLLFTRPDSNVILGSIPVTINAGKYAYPVQALDADGDPITFRLLEAPDGAVVDATSGRITWAPPAVGLYHFVVQADDGRGGRDVQEYDVNVTTGAENHPPTIDSTAPTQATERLPFGYSISASDPDGDLLSYFLTQAPDGMTINGVTGQISWTPTHAQLGDHNVAVRVLDGRGGEAIQNFTLSVGPDLANRAPRIVSTPLTAIVTGELYRYGAVAADDDGDALTFELVVAPDGMSVDATSGAIGWLPTTADVGDQLVILRVRDGRGGVNLQSYHVAVAAIGTAPYFTTPAPTAPAVVGELYEYRFRAQDADGDTITFRLDAAADHMSIDPNTGVLSWTPAANQVRGHALIVTAVDSRGARTSLPFTLNVLASAANDQPTIDSAPRTSIALGATYLYQLIASDPNNDQLTITLTTAPAGITIDGERMIRWEPAPGQLGDNAVAIRVDDGRGGVVTQSFTVDVTPQRSNQSPQIVSPPLLAATVGRHYDYHPQGVDPDSDPLLWSLKTAPQGLSIHPTLGMLRWEPVAEQLGAQEVVVRLDDGQGGFSTQSFVVVVRASNLPPTFVSSPPTQGTVGQGYTYATRAEDVEGDPLHYLLSTSPVGMAINATTGLIQWTPTAGQVGPRQVSVEVSDGLGGIATQSFTVVVSAAPPNLPPTITTTPGNRAIADSPYRYDADATDPEGGALAFALTTAPAGMTIDAATGVINWTPNDSQLGGQRVTLKVTDSAGNNASQNYLLFVQAANRPPIINSTAMLFTTAGQVYRYDVNASDPDGDALTYALTSAPAGMTIDTLGRITWSPAISDIAAHHITVDVADPFGASVSQSFDLDVIADTQSPNVIVELSESPANLGSQVIIFTSATDNVGVVELTLTVNGILLPVDPNGMAVFDSDQVGTFDVAALAADAAGNTSMATTTLFVIDPSDANAPDVAIDSPSDGAEIANFLDVIGTANDDNLLFYTLEVAPFGSRAFTEIARSTTAVVNGVLGQFDPTMLQNDSYVLRLSATDSGGNTATVEQTVHVAGELKLGNFSLAFTDLSVPVLGVPITVSRTYDTLTAAQSSDFGFGWRLDFRNMNLRTSVTPTGFEEFGIFNPLKSGSRVYVNLPGGNRQGFTFRPQPAPGFRGGFLGIFEPRFVPDAGVKSSLTVTPADLRINADGRVFDYGTGTPYNPASGLFGGSYLLTSKDGISFDIDGETGQLTALSDPNDNTLTFSDTGVTGPDGVSITFERDPQGRITSIVDPAGRRIRYQYDARGDLIGVTDRTDNTTQFVYRSSPAHYLDNVIDPLGRTGARTEYDSQGRLSKIFDAAGNPMQFAFDPRNLVATVTDPFGNPVTEEYDARGNILSQIDALGGITQRTFDADNNMLTERDQLGQTTTFTYNDRGDVLTRTDPLGHTTISTYEAFTFGTTALAATRGEASAPFTRVRTTTDALGNTQRLSYDGSGNLTTTTDPSGDVTVLGYDRPGRPPVSVTDADGRVTQFETLNGLLMRQVDPLGHETSFTYDANGNELTSTTTLTAADGTSRSLMTLTDYDAEGRVVAVTDTEGSITRTEYDAAGNRAATTDAMGRRTEYRYDERNLLTETIFPDATPAELSDNPRTLNEYDDVGHETARIDELGRRTEYQYDAAGRLVKVIYPDSTPLDPLDNPFTQTEYDLAGQVTAQLDERRNRTEFEYDKVGRRIVVRDASGHETLSAYDDAGRRVLVTDPLGHTTHFINDERGLVVRTIYADDTSTSSTFDSLRRLVARTDQEAATTRYEYDAVGQLTAVVDALDHRTEYTLDEAGNVIRSRDANGHVTTYEYDGRSRQVSLTLPLQQKWVTNYDAVGNVVSTTDANGQTILFEYDERNRLTKKDFPTGTDVAFTYTLTGQRKSETDSRGVTIYEYDERNRLILRDEPDGSAIAYAYDGASNQTSVTTTVFGNAPRVTSFTFDADNRLETVTDAELGVTSYSYDAVGNLTRTELSNGTVESRAYDEQNRLTLLEQTDSSGVLASYRYTFTPTGRKASVEEHDGRRVGYTYDPVGRLVQEDISDVIFGDRTFDYTYDAVGNRLTREDSDAGLTEYEYDANDRLLTETLAGALTEYIYDNNGNTLSRVSAADQVFNTWDFENRLIASDVTDATATRHLDYHYNADGVRVAAVVDGAETRYLIDANRALAEVLVEYTSGGLIVVSYIRGHDLIAQTRSGGPSFYLADGQGSIRALATAAGLVTDRYSYDAFGVVISSQGTTPNTYRFLGEQVDSNLGLTYLRARYLDPQLGRFASRDPFPGLWSDPTSLNRYMYAGGDPVNRIDPTGLFVITIELSFSFVIQNILRGLGGFVGSEIADELGLGIPGRIVGAIAGGWAFGRFGAWLAANPATEVAAAQTARTALRQLPAKGSSYAYKGHVNFANGVVRSNGKHFNVLLGSVVPPPAFVAIYRNAREHEPSGNEALCAMDGLFREMYDNASDPYTAEFYLTQLAALRAAGGNPCAPHGLTPDA